MRIIPAIDIINGKCVRLAQGDFTRQKVYDDDPLSVAKMFESNGIRFLHLVDLDGAKQGQVVNWKTVEMITSNTNLVVDFGGGIKTDDDIDKLFTLGVSQVNLGSIAINRPYRVYEWLEKFGKDKIILSADVRGKNVAIDGWQKDSGVDVIQFIQGFVKQGLQYLTCTDIATDGMLSGPNLRLYEEIMRHFPELKVIASGGVSSTNDIESLVRIDVDGAIIGKAIYENRIDLKSLTEFE